jgi:hypothetical protein
VRLLGDDVRVVDVADVKERDEGVVVDEVVELARAGAEGLVAGVDERTKRSVGRFVR